MVMDASPSPQSVGREFVRQYYTLLNKAPAHLHRFYNNTSSFVHGGLDAPNRETPPVIGQKQIHNRIQQLNFRDCHAKISQVDSQATLGNGVVVQVSGELSNDGAPMRRFTQTFVLGAQSPKKYYVHNDIFRYQDIVFSDEEGSGDGVSEGSEEEGRVFGFPAPPQLPPAPAPAPAPVNVNVDPLNGHPPLEQPSPPLREEPPQPEPEPPAPAPEPPRPSSPPAPLVSLPPEPKTYANLLKSSSHQPRPQPQPAPVAPAEQRPRPPRAAPVNKESAGAPESAPPLSPPGAGAGVGVGAGRRYSDAQQLFLGNVPASATEDELRAIFSRFGVVAELRVHVKAGAGGAAAGRHPNYGFITYESAAAAQSALNSGALFYPLGSGEAGVKLNVEEKKARREPPRGRRPPPHAQHPAHPHSAHSAHPPRNNFARR